MAIVYLGNFHGCDINLTTVSAAITELNDNDYVSYGLTGNGAMTSRIGRDLDNPVKSKVTLLTNSTISALSFNLAKSLSKLAQGSDDCAVLGFMYKYTGVAASKTTALSISIPGSPATPLTGTFLKDVTYNVEIKVMRTGYTPHENISIFVYVDKALVGSNDKLLTLPLINVGSENQTITDIVISIDKEDDEVKSDLPGPLEVFHHTATIATDVDDWSVVNGTPQSTPIPSLNAVKALADADIGKAATSKSLALSGKNGKFKFGTVTPGEFECYSIDMYVNKPRGCTGDLLYEVTSDGVEVPLVTKKITNITSAANTSQYVNLITSNSTITDAELKLLNVSLSSKRIII